MAIAMINVTTDKLVAVNGAFPNHVAAAPASCRQPPLAVRGAAQTDYYGTLNYYLPTIALPGVRRLFLE